MAPRTVKLGEQRQQTADGQYLGLGRRVIGIELRIAPDEMGSAQEEVFMEGLDIELPPFYGGRGLDWSVTLHTTNGDVTLDTRQGGTVNNIRQ